MNSKPDTRIGVIVPAGNTVHEKEFGLLRPEGVSFRFAEFSSPPSSSADFCGDLAAQLRGPIGALKAWGADLILIGCTTASMTCSDAAFRQTLEGFAGVPVVTAAGASMDAVKALAVESVSVATPYGDRNNQVVAAFLNANAVAVAAIAGLNLDRSPEVWRAQAPTMSPQAVLDFGLATDVDGAQALYMPCTAIQSLEAIAPFEEKTGKPAFSSVQAGYWAGLRRLGVDGRRKGFGRLVEQWDF
jgi:maleate cis-trans isomerase